MAVPLIGTDGSISNLSGCTVGPGPNQCPDINGDTIHSGQLDTTADWTQVNAQFIHFNFQFQCTPGYQTDLMSAKGSQLGRRHIKVPAGWPMQVVIQQ